MSLPALQHLRTAYPEARITILARPWVAALYRREPFCDEIIPYSGNLAERLASAVKLRARKFDCAILLQNAFEAAAVAWLAGVPVRIGYDRDARGWLLTHSVPVPKPGEIPKHERFYYLELLRRTGIIADYDRDAPIRLAGANAARGEGEAFSKTLVKSSSIIGVSPGAAFGGAKRWLPERFAASAIQIARPLEAAVLVFGSKAEFEICSLVADTVEQAGVEALNMAGRTSLDEFVNLAAACRLMLTNDSGAMHIASALGVPSVTVFGATDEEATGPLGPLARIVRVPVECSPCLLRECPIDHRCMTRVEAEQVTKAAAEVLDAAKQ